MRRLKSFSLNIALLTASFTTGIAAGTGFCQFSWAQSINSQTIACSTASILVTLALTRTCRMRESGGWLVGLYFLVGVLCGCTAVASSCSAPGAGPLQIAAEGFAARFRSMILSLPFPHPESPVLVNALLTGDKSGLDKDIISAFRDSGAAHILALSGLHLGIIYGILRKVTSVMGNSPTANKIRSAGIIFTTFLYTLATGAGPSLVRAQLFITINEISHLAQRRTSLGKVYCSALLIQLTMNPLVISSVGFQLSYMAMAGIVVLYPRMKAWFPENEEGRTKFVSYVPKKMWDAMALAISCQIFTGPVAWLYFGTFPKYFIITNMFALPITSLLMIMATLTATLSAAGLCPTIIISITDKLSMMLIDIVQIIAEL